MPKSNDKTPVKKATPAVAGKKKATTCGGKVLLGVIAQIGLQHGGMAPRDLVARRAGYGSAVNASFKKAILRAANRGHVDTFDKTCLGLTESGLKEAGDPPKVETNEDTQNRIKEGLTPKMVEAFELLLDGKPHLRSDMAPKLGYGSTKEQGFKKLLLRMKGQCLDFTDKDNVQLSELCFPLGRN